MPQFFFKIWPIAKNSSSLYSPMVANVLIKFVRHLDENCRSSALKFPVPYGPVLTKISKCHKIFSFGQIAEKGNNLYSPPDYHAFHKIWMKLNEKRGGSGLSKILTSEILQSAPTDPKLNLNDLTQKVPCI